MARNPEELTGGVSGPGEELWRAIIELDNAVHRSEAIVCHTSDETIGVHATNMAGEMVTQELDYFHDFHVGVYWPRIRNTIKRGNNDLVEIFMLDSDSQVIHQDASGRSVHGGAETMRSMTSRIELMLHKIKQDKPGTYWWIDTDIKKT